MDRFHELAQSLFLERGGMAGPGEKNERMRQAAFGIRDELEDRLNVKSSYAFSEDFSLEGEELVLAAGAQAGPAMQDGPLTLRCTAFSQIDPEWVEGVFAYAVSVGDFHLDDRSVMDQLYADMWGSAFADAAREMLVEEIAQECYSAGLDDSEVYGISESFGPGFYGMDVSEMAKLSLLVDFDQVGIQLTESGLLLPEKSCAGIVFKVNDGYKPLGPGCQSCLGNKNGCSMCSLR